MNKMVFGFRGLVSKIGSEKLFRWAFHLFLILAFGGGISQTMPVQASSLSQQTGQWQTTYSLHVDWPKAPICAGQNYSVTADASKKSVNTQNGDNPTIAESMEGIKIDASVDNSAAATISPESIQTGVAELTSPGGVDPFVAEFTLHAVKPGTASIQIETTFNNAAGKTASLLQTFKVVNCKYKVTAVSSWSFSAPNLFSHLAESSKGEMQLVSGSDDTLKGTSDVTWDMSSFSELCGHNHDIPPAKAQLDSTVADGTLKVTITFDPFDMSTQNCGSSSAGQFAIPAFTVTVSEEGGTKGGDHSFEVGDETMHGYTTVIVTPVEAP